MTETNLRVKAKLNSPEIQQTNDTVYTYIHRKELFLIPKSGSPFCQTLIESFYTQFTIGAIALSTCKLLEHCYWIASHHWMAHIIHYNVIVVSKGSKQRKHTHTHTGTIIIFTDSSFLIVLDHFIVILMILLGTLIY